MFPFFKKKQVDEIKKTGRESSVSSEEFLDQQVEDQEQEIETALSIHPNWNLPKEQEYVFRFLNNDLQPLKPNQISLSGVELEQDNGSLQVTAFVRNSIAKPIRLEKVELLLLNADKDVIGRKEFDLSELGEIPAKSSRPWMFVFEQGTLASQDMPSEGWSLAFNVSSMQPHRLDLAEAWKESLPEEEQNKLAELVKTLPKPKSKEFNIMGLQAKFLENGNLNITVLFRNGNHKGIQIQQLPLEVYDANQDVVARGAFKLEDFEVKANTTKPWSLIYPKEMILKENPDFSKWIVKPFQGGTK